MTQPSPPQPSTTPLRGQQPGINVTIFSVLPTGWRSITRGFVQSEAWILHRIAADLRGESFGQKKADAVEFALLDSHNGLSVIRPITSLKTGAEGY